MQFVRFEVLGSFVANIVKGDGKSFGECKYGVKVLNKIQLKEMERVCWASEGCKYDVKKFMEIRWRIDRNFRT